MEKHVADLFGCRQTDSFPAGDPTVLILKDVKFRLELSGFGIEKENYKISALRGSRLSDVELQGSSVSFTVDKLGPWEIFVIE